MHHRFPMTQLQALGELLQADGKSARVLVVGGAALLLRGWVSRTTHDVDVLAVVDESLRRARTSDLSDLEPYTRRVADDFELQADWFNSAVALQWQTGLPPRLRDDVAWRSFAALHVGIAGRSTMIALKLCATADHSPRSVHCQDLLALAPTDVELREARTWALTQDHSEAWPQLLDEVIHHVQTRRSS